MAKKILPLSLILILGLGLRLINLGQSFWLDEAAQAVMSVRDLNFIWSGRGGDFHPPLFYLLAHFWLLVNHSEFWARLLSVSFNLATVYLVYLIAGVLFPKTPIKLGPVRFSPELLAAFLMAVNPYFIYYAQEFRSYSLLAFLGTFSMYLWLTRRFVALAIVNAALLYTHYASIFLLLTQVFIWFSTARRQRNYWYSLTASLLLFLPWLPQLAVQIQSGFSLSQALPGWENLLSVSPLKAVPLVLFKLTAGRISFLSRYLYGAYIGMVMAILGFILFVARPLQKFLHYWLFCPLLIMLLVSLALPQNQPFRVIYIVPALVLLSVQAGFRFPKLVLTFLIYIALVGNISYFSRPRLQREQWRQAVAYLNLSPAPIIVKFSGPFAPLSWYPLAAPVYSVVPTPPATFNQVNSELPPLTVPRIWLIRYLGDLTDPHHQVEAVLAARGYVLDQTIDFTGVGFIDSFALAL